MKSLLFVSLLSIALTGDKLEPKDKVFIIFKPTAGRVDSDQMYSIKVLKEYIINKSSLALVDKSEEADFTFVLSMYENTVPAIKGKNIGKIDIIRNETNKAIFESTWTLGKAAKYFGYSRIRHAIGTIFNKEILRRYPNIEADNRK